MSRNNFNRLRLERLKRRISQWDVAKATGIHPTIISKFESGNITLSEGQIIKIREALGISEKGEVCN